MDVTTLALSVDSTQVNSAAAALDRMAVSGTKAEGAADALTKASADQSRTLTSLLVPAAAKSALGFKDLAAAQASLGPAAAKQLAEAIAKLNDTDAEARAATASLTAMGNAGAAAGAKVSSALAAAAGGAVPSLAGTIAAPGPNRATASPIGATVISGAAAIKSAGDAVKQAAKDTADFGAKSEFTTQQVQGMVHSVRAFVDQVVAGQSPVRAFALEAGKLSGTFGGAGNAFSAITSLITPLRVAMLGAAAGVGALALAFEEGQKQGKLFADALVNTGNAAGQTQGGLRASAEEIAKATNQSVGSIRDFQLELLKTGQIGPKVFDQATAAAFAYSQATGKTAEEVAKDFAALARAPSKFASEANLSLNVLTAGQLQLIRQFEETGRAADAQGIVFDALITRIPKLQENLTALGGVLHNLSTGWRNFWDNAENVGRPETFEQKLEAINRRLTGAAPDTLDPRTVRESGETPGLALSFPTEGNAQKADDLRIRSSIALGIQAQRETAIAAANRAEIQRAGDAANKFADAQLSAGHSTEALNKALEKNSEVAAAAQRAGTPLSGQQIKDLDERARKEHGPVGSLARAAARFDKADLDADLKVFKDHLQDEQDALTLADRLLQGEYRAGNSSLAQFYADRNAIDSKGLADKIAELEQERARIQQSIDKEKDPAQRRTLESKRDEAGAQEEKLRVKFAGDQKLANQEATASFKALADSVTNYRAGLLQLAGDEEGAAKLRAAQTIEQATLLARQATPLSTPGDFARFDKQHDAGTDLFSKAAQQKQLIDDQIALNAAKEKTGQIDSILALEEDRIALAQKTGAITSIAALQATGEARKALVSQLEDQVKEQERIAALPENALNFKIQLDVAQARLNIEKLKTDLDPLKKKFDDLFTGAGTNALADLLNGTKSFKAAATDFLKTISTGINNTIAQNASETFFGEKGPGAGAGGFVSNLLFGGGKKDASTASAKASVDTSSVIASLTNLQTAGVDPLTSSFARLLQVVDAAGNRPLTVDANGAGIDAAGHGFSAARDGAPTGEQSIVNLFKDETSTADKANASTAALSASATTAASDVLRLAASAGQGGNALSLLPSIIQLIQAAASGSSASSAVSGSGGGIGSFFSGLFGGSKTGGIDAAGHGFNAGADSAAADLPVDDIASLFFHRGGVVGEERDMRPVRPSVFAAAAKYHEGGVVGGNSIAGLSANEVPAILMGGPKGTREEVLHASDPRHKDNLAPALLKVITDAQGQPKSVLAALAGSDAGDKAEAPTSGAVARMVLHDKQTHELSPLTRYLIGSPSTVTSLITELSKESDFESITSLRDIKHVMGARELGGPVSSNSAYRVNERGPELLEVAGKQYLMTGNQGGNVQAAEQPAQRPVSITNHFAIPAPTSRQTQDQIAALTARAAARALGRGAA